MNHLSRPEIEAAALRIAPHTRKTPVLDVIIPNHTAPINLKLELFQHTGSFKVRGAFNSLLGVDIPASGVSAVSGGNHGAAVAYAARQLGLKARIFVPGLAAPHKVARIKSYGAEVVQQGTDVGDAIKLWQAYNAETGAFAIHPYDAWPTLQGQATTALEWHAQAPDLDTVLIAVGGGGLIGGMASFYNNKVKVIGVETTGCATLHTALAIMPQVRAVSQ